MTFGSLFAGIGGFDLGFERAGMKCAWQVELDPFCRRVLAKHWPDVRRWDDVRTFPPEPAGDWSVDLICGGFPCQDISNAGRRAGIGGERSGLWSEFARIIRVVRPRFVVVENVPGLLVRGIGRVLGELAALGFDAEWSVVSACAMGAPHTRERLFVLGYAASVTPGGDCRSNSAKACQGWLSKSGIRLGPARPSWGSEPDVGRVADGIPARMDRLSGLGNAVVPQVAEFIARRIVQVAESRS